MGNQYTVQSSVAGSAKRRGIRPKALIATCWHRSEGSARKILEASDDVCLDDYFVTETKTKFPFAGDWGEFKDVVKKDWYLIEQAFQAAEHAEAWIVKNKPQAVVVWNDFQPSEAGLVMAAKELNIPTIMVAHGSMMGLHPGQFGNDTIADWCLGSYAVRQMYKDFEADIDCVATGMPDLDPWSRAREAPIQESARTDLGLKLKKPVITWVGTWSRSRRIWDSNEALLFMSFIKAVKAVKEIVPDLQINVCPHPSGKFTLEEYRTVLEENEIKDDYLCIEKMTELCVAASNLLVGARSSVMSQGLMCDVPSIVLDYKPWHEWTWFRGKGFLLAENVRELISLMTSMFVEDEKYKQLVAECRVGAEWFASTPDGKASNRAARTIERITLGKEVDEQCWAPIPDQV